MKLRVIGRAWVTNQVRVETNDENTEAVNSLKYLGSSFNEDEALQDVGEIRMRDRKPLLY